MSSPGMWPSGYMVRAPGKCGDDKILHGDELPWVEYAACVLRKRPDVAERLPKLGLPAPRI